MTTQQSRKNIFTTSILFITLMAMLLFGLNAIQVGAETAAADLSNSTKTVDVSEAEVNEKVTYTVLVKNSGDASAGTVYMTDTLPANVTLDVSSLSYPDTISNGFTNAASASGSTVTWNGLLGPEAEIALTFEATVNSSVPLGTIITNTATIMNSGTNISRQAATTVVSDTTKSVYLPIVMNRYPPIPLKPTLTDTELSGTQYRLDWTIADADTIDFYLLHTSNDCTFDNRDIIQVNATTYTVDAGDALCYRVAGVNSFGLGEWSNIVKLANANLTADKLTVNASSDECTTLRWDFTGISAFYMNFAHGFKQRATSGTGTETVCPSVTTTYEARIVDSNGSESTASVTINVTGSGCNKDPYINKFESSVSSVNDNTDFTVSWDVQCATGIYYSVGSGSESPATGVETRTERLTSDTAYKIRVTGRDSFDDFNDLVVKNNN